MAGIKGMTQAGCVGHTDDEVWAMCEKQYSDFCQYRHSLSRHMPDLGTALFDKRIFNNGRFENE